MYLDVWPSVYFYSKDVRLPQNLQRAMAAEAEAAREARAKVCLVVVLAFCCF
jgi:regulator of protease activity HflC (stomatin/prohibitin superfamily)